MRKMARVSCISPPIELRGFNNNIDALERAVLERVFYVKNKNAEFVAPPAPINGAFSYVMAPVKEMLVKFLPFSVPLSRRQFAETFRGRKRVIYNSAVDSLYQKSVTQRDAAVKVFVKYEKTNMSAKKEPVPRVISPRSPRFNVELGKFLRQVEEPIFHSLSLLFEGKRTVFKGMNATDSGQAMFDLWSSFKKPVALGLDA